MGSLVLIGSVFPAFGGSLSNGVTAERQLIRPG
jgi:hypothetical protein